MSAPNVKALSAEEREQAVHELANASAEAVLTWVEKHLGASAALASSFGAEDVVLIELAARHAPSLRVFTLDTGRLHPETYELMETLRLRYALNLETYFPERAGVEQLESQGYFTFKESLAQRKACCAVRKVEPLRRALASRQAWVTGLRREQSVTRAEVPVAEVDTAHGGILKLNPLAGWSEAQVWEFIGKNHLPYNLLHDRGFPSIGCAPCTRAIKPYEDARAGRWWWESPEHKECGLHVRS